MTIAEVAWALDEICARILGDEEAAATEYLRPCILCGRYCSLHKSMYCEWCRRGALRGGLARAIPIPLGYVIPMTPRPTPVEGHDAYRAGRCSRCLTAPYAPGRTLCDPCWRDRVGGIELAEPEGRRPR
jgi:hypothetical protein